MRRHVQPKSLLGIAIGNRFARIRHGGDFTLRPGSPAALNLCKLSDGRSHLTTALVQYTAAAVSDRGRKRPSNEDAFGYSVEHGVYVVCDGMGGAAAGEIASSLAVDEMMRLLVAEEPGAPAAEDAVKAVAAANQAIYTRSRRNPKLAGMGTTMVALIAAERQVWMLNVGDSRGYRLRNAGLQQVTEDHSLVEEQVRMGRMNRTEALRSPLRNVITRALGTQIQVTPDVFALEAEPGDLYLLCSDGLTREISDRLIESLLRLDLPLDELCDRLVSAANKAGGHDNITCLLVRAG
jgi:PPM family protein phosphatase